MLQSAEHVLHSPYIHVHACELHVCTVLGYVAPVQKVEDSPVGMGLSACTPVVHEITRVCRPLEQTFEQEVHG